MLKVACMAYFWPMKAQKYIFGSIMVLGINAHKNWKGRFTSKINLPSLVPRQFGLPGNQLCQAQISMRNVTNNTAKRETYLVYFWIKKVGAQHK